MRLRPHAGIAVPPLVVAVAFAALVLVTTCVTDTESGGPQASEAVEAPAVPPDVVATLEDSTRAPRYPRLLDEAGGSELEAVPATSPPRPPTDPQIEALLDTLTLRQRIGQRFISQVQGSRVAYGAGRAIVEVAPAGFILYPWNYQTADDVRRLTSSLQFVTSQVTPAIHPLIAADQEGGRVAAFRFAEFVRFPSAAAMGRFNDPALIRSAAHITAAQLRDLGLSMNLAPVLDLYGIPDASIIGDRSYGADPYAVSLLTGPYLDAMRESSVVATAKHFPGHGVSTVDSHARLPVIQTTRAELDATHLIPFREAIAAGVPAIMTGHLLFERIDPFYPVTLSRVFLHDILRRELGFQGVVVTDGLEMRALRDNYSLAQTLVRLFRYDVDLILLYQEYDVVELVDMVEDLIAAGAITEDDVNRGVRRVLSLKRAYGLLNLEAL